MHADKKRPEIVLQFKAGDPVPEWMLETVPMTPDAVRGSLVFDRDGCVVETSVTYTIVMDDGRMPAIYWSNSDHIRISAVTKKVLFSNGTAICIATE